VLVLVLAGCGGVKPAPPGASPPTAAQAESAKAAPAAPSVTPVSPPPQTPSPAPPAPTAAAQGPTAAIEQAVPSAPAPAKSAAKAEAPVAKASAKAPAAPAPSAQPPKKDIAQEPAKPKAEAPLDLTSLETRLKETKAIGLMTKIALKNQVDDLLNQFRAFYAGKLQTTLADLRRPYDLLVLKVLSLLQDSDPTLAAAIAASREAIWSILSDRAKFANVASN
jgi:hypothetical protein